MGEDELCFEFGAGAGRDVQEAQDLDGCAAVVALCDVLGDRARGFLSSEVRPKRSSDGKSCVVRLMSRQS